MITPKARLMHIIGASSATSAAKLVLLQKGRATLVRRHWPAFWRPWGTAMLMAWISNRHLATNILAALMPVRFGAQRDKWREVWRRRGEWMNGYGSG
jgi:hypothetical protein